MLTMTTDTGTFVYIVVKVFDITLHLIVTCRLESLSNAHNSAKA